MTIAAPPDSSLADPALLSSAPSESPCALIDLSIIIVNWNTRDDLRACLQSVYANFGHLQVEVIVIDNASSDASVAMIRKQFPNVSIILNDRNRGFAAANNQGMRIARGRYILLLNPDTIALDHVFEHAVSHADTHPDIGVLGCQVLDGPDSIQRTCFRFPSPLNTLMWVTGLSACFPRARFSGRAAYGPWSRDNARDIDVVSGMFMLVRRTALRDVGLMDERFFVFAEEADWCRRFHDRGWRCTFAPFGRILHVEGGSKSTNQASVKMYVEMQKNILLYHRKHYRRTVYGLTKLLFSTFMPLRALWWSFCSALHLGARSDHKARQSVAAARFHFTGEEPPW